MAAVEDISLVPTPPLTLLAGGGSFDIALVGVVGTIPQAACQLAQAPCRVFVTAHDGPTPPQWWLEDP